MRRHPTRSITSATVSIHVRTVAQMFNSLDPSPFWDRDLDKDAAQFIEEEFSEKLSAGVWHLRLHTQGVPGSSLTCRPRWSTTMNG